MTTLTYGHQRKSTVPADGGKTKVCPRCDLWFSAGYRQRVCDRCRPNETKAKIASKTKTHPGTPGYPRKPEYAQVTGTQKSTWDARTGIWSDGGALCRELARELALKIDYPQGPPVLTRAVKRAITRRNVELGLQA